MLYIRPCNPSRVCKGKQQLRDLGIATVYDLRSETEMHKYETPIPSIDGVKVVHVPVFSKEDYSPEAMTQYVESSSQAPRTYNVILPACYADDFSFMLVGRLRYVLKLCTYCILPELPTRRL